MFVLLHHVEMQLHFLLYLPVCIFLLRDRNIVHHVIVLASHSVFIDQILIYWNFFSDTKF